MTEPVTNIDPYLIEAMNAATPGNGTSEGLVEMLDGLSPLTSGSGETGGMSVGDKCSMGLQASAALISGIGQWASLGIQNRTQNNHFAAMNELADSKMEMQISALNAQEERMKVVASVKKHKNTGSIERAEAEAELQVAQKLLAESEATRKATKVDVSKLDGIFARNDWFYGAS